MTQSDRLLVTLSLDKAQPVKRGHYYKPRPLKSLSTRLIWILVESMEYQLRNSLYFSWAKIMVLRKRHRDLSAELTERIEYDNNMCKAYGKAYENGKLLYVPSWADPLNPPHMDKEIEDFRKGEETQSKKSLGKVYIKGSRLRPGKKVEWSRRRNKVKA